MLLTTPPASFAVCKQKPWECLTQLFSNVFLLSILYPEVCLSRLYFAPIFSFPCDLNSVSPGASKSTLSVRLSASSPLCGRERNSLCAVWWIYRWRTRRIAQPRLCLRWALAKPRKKKRWCFQAPTIIIQECNWFGQKENWNVSVEPQKFLKLRFGILVKS